MFKILSQRILDLSFDHRPCLQVFVLDIHGPNTLYFKLLAFVAHGSERADFEEQNQFGE
jgi:hypothetical protein